MAAGFLAKPPEITWVPSKASAVPSKASAPHEQASDLRKPEEAITWQERLKQFEDFLEKYRSPEYKVMALQVVVTWAIWLTLSMFVWAFVYPDEPDVEKHMDMESFERDPVKTFTARHFGCFQTPMITFCACVCPALRWADTVNLAGIMRFRAAIAGFAFCALLNGLTYNTALIYGIFTWLLIVYCRQKLRARLNLPNWTCLSCCCDIFFVFCCTCCAIAQEARVVRYSYERSVTGVPATRPAALQPTQSLLQRPVVTWQSPLPVRQQQYGPYGST